LMLLHYLQTSSWRARGSPRIAGRACGQGQSQQRRGRGPCPTPQRHGHAQREAAPNRQPQAVQQASQHAAWHGFFHLMQAQRATGGHAGLGPHRGARQGHQSHWPVGADPALKQLAKMAANSDHCAPNRGADVPRAALGHKTCCITMPYGMQPPQPFAAHLAILSGFSLAHPQRSPITDNL